MKIKDENIKEMMIYLETAFPEIGECTITPYKAELHSKDEIYSVRLVITNDNGVHTFYFSIGKVDNEYFVHEKDLAMIGGLREYLTTGDNSSFDILTKLLGLKKFFSSNDHRKVIDVLRKMRKHISKANKQAKKKKDYDFKAVNVTPLKTIDTHLLPKTFYRFYIGFVALFSLFFVGYTLIGSADYYVLFIIPILFFISGSFVLRRSKEIKKELPMYVKDNLTYANPNEIMTAIFIISTLFHIALVILLVSYAVDITKIIPK